MYINHLATGIMPLSSPSPASSSQKQTESLFKSTGEPTYLRSVPPHTESRVSTQQVEKTEKALGAGLILVVSLLIIAKVFNIKELLKYSPNTGKANAVKRIPCTDCDYFSDNFYLRCAIHPYAALTEQAVDCRDFCPKRKGRARETIEK